MTPREYFQAGRLDDAIEAATEVVRTQPMEVDARSMLAELLCFRGDLERADKQLDVLSTQVPDATVGVAIFRQLIRAETSRREFYDAGRVPELLAEPTPSQERQFRALVAIREGREDEALQLLDEAEELRPTPTGTVDGERFDDFRDLDDLVASSLEVLTNNGKYYWIPLERITLLERRAPEYVRDLLWAPAHLEVHGGPDGEVFLPMLYFGSHASEDTALALGRATEWTGGDGSPVRGVGQRSFLVGETDRPLQDLDSVAFDDVAG